MILLTLCRMGKNRQRWPEKLPVLPATPSSSLRISRKHALGARRILEFMLRSYPVLSIKAVCVASIDVELVGPVSDVLGRYDYERRIVCVINHSNNLSALDRQVHGCAPGCGVLYEPLALAYPLRRSRAVLKTTLRRSSRWRWLARVRNCGEPRRNQTFNPQIKSYRLDVHPRLACAFPSGLGRLDVYRHPSFLPASSR